VSAPGPVVMGEFGFTPEHIVETAKALLKREEEDGFAMNHELSL
jgi:hypothetical protein